MQNIILNVFKTASYPPTEDQLAVIGFFGNNLGFLRVFSLFLLLIGLFFWFKTLSKFLPKWLSLISCLIVFLSPTFYVLWLAYPLDCFKILLTLVLVYFVNKKSVWLILIGSIFLIVFSFGTSSERSSFVHKFSLKDASGEVQERFAAEDSLIDPIKIPLKVKRIVYNKYFIEYKELINEIILFFDEESIFFQEIHPMEQKSVVIFVWPEVFLLIGGAYFLISKGNKKINLLIISFLFLSLVNFLFDPFTTFRKFELILFPFGLVMTIAVNEIIKTKILFGKVCGVVVIFLSVYGIAANHWDLNKRPDYWLDNRPYFFEFVFNTINQKDLNNFNKIHITSLVGKTNEYCQYYLKNCGTNKFSFESFDLENKRPENNEIYAGFVGEFVGSDFKNNINSNWLTMINDKGFANVVNKKLRDTIAYKFGEHIVVGESRW